MASNSSCFAVMIAMSIMQASLRSPMAKTSGKIGSAIREYAILTRLTTLPETLVRRAFHARRLGICVQMHNALPGKRCRGWPVNKDFLGFRLFELCPVSAIVDRKSVV